jgi:hypothetical protein
MASESSTESETAVYNLAHVWLICIVAAMGGMLFGYN